ncbi:bZIP transcription factor [Halorubrum ejinorense]|uniref:BZIP transcription factor n=1 Tax=Halorubrum ejinorense TaxID=425309 RepID=A0AAV3SQR1_9EURY
MSNRVEDLERQVAELQAAVNGLTEELVEMKERVRQLEDERSVGVETGSTAGSAEATDSPEATPNAASDESDAQSATASDGERTTHSDDHVDVFESVEGSSDGDEATAEADGDDVIVPEQSATTPDAEASTDEADEDESESSEGDDIIVA